MNRRARRWHSAPQINLPDMLAEPRQLAPESDSAGHTACAADEERVTSADLMGKSPGSETTQRTGAEECDREARRVRDSF